MIFKRRLSAPLLVLLLGALTAAGTNKDLKSDSDDLQTAFTDPSEASIKPPSRNLYSKEIGQCPSGEGKMMLTLLLQSLKWNDISERKKEKAIKKLSRFFLVPRQFITVSDIHTPEILEMLKHSINKSNNLLNAKDTVARFEFMIGCGDKMFDNGKFIARHISEYMKSGVLDELSGLPFNWWNIWSKHVKSRVQRTRRQIDGSGNDEEGDGETDGEDDYYEEDYEEGQDGDAALNEKLPETPRVRHNQRKKNSNKRKLKKISSVQVQDEPSVAEKETISVMVPEDVAVSPDIPSLDIESNTQGIQQTESQITPIDVIENIKLESYVNKTIVNDNNVVDVPVFQQKDKMLEEVKKLISEPPEELTTIQFTSTDTTTVKITTETTTELPSTMMTTTTTTIVPSTTTIPTTMTTVFIEETTIAVTLAPAAPETETIFDPIMTHHNENINAYDENLLVLTTESTTRLEDDVTEPTTTQDHETTSISITTLPPTTESVVTTEPSTTTIRIVDATLAMDKAPTVSPSSNEIENETVEKPTEERKKSEYEEYEDSSKKPKETPERKKPDEESESNYDDLYDDELPDENNPAPTQAPTTTQATTTRTTIEVTSPSTIYEEEETVSSSTAAAPTTIDLATTPQSLSMSSEAPVVADDYEDVNLPPRVDKRIPKSAVTAGKPFVIKIESNVFFDEEDKTNLKLELFDKNKQPISSIPWIRFDPVKREIYGLPLESDVSQYEFKLQATDSAGESVDESVGITVQQYKGYRSANHEIYIQIKLEKHYESPVDWEIRLVRGIVEALDDGSTGSVVVREIRPNKHDPGMFTFVFTNESLPKDHCPKEELELLMTRLTKTTLNEAMRREITVRSVNKDLIGSCQNQPPPKSNIVPSNTKNFPPTVRNPVDQVKAYVGQLLVFEVPKDTFYDPEDITDLKLTLLNEDRSRLESNHWLQFDAKNSEFYGVPTIHDKNQQYILVAEDKNGLTANDALMVEVNHGVFKRDYSVSFEYQLDMSIDQFRNAATKRKFIEGIARAFQDPDTSNILLKWDKKLQYAGRTAVLIQNKTLYRESRECPTHEVEKLRTVLLRQDRSVRDEVKDTIGNDFNVLKITAAPTGNCAGGDTIHHPEEKLNNNEEEETPIISQDLLITYVLPASIIVLMLLIALLIACLLYKRRNTGKMDLVDEEERKSFRSKGIPVIFQDELEDTPEILTKSPVILKDEKPPLLPQYNGLSQDEDEDNMDQYIPPQPLLMGNRESRGKSPVTPSYRKPPPYVSP